MKQTSLKSLTAASLLMISTLATASFAESLTKPVPCFPFGLADDEAANADGAAISDALAQWTSMGVFSIDPGFLNSYQSFKAFLTNTNLLSDVSKETKPDGSTVYHLSGMNTVGGDAIDGGGTLAITIKETDAGIFKSAVYQPGLITKKLPGTPMSEDERLAVVVFLDVARITLAGKNPAVGEPVKRFLSVNEQGGYVTKVDVKKQNGNKSQIINFVGSSGDTNVLTVIRTLTSAWPQTVTYHVAFGPF